MEISRFSFLEDELSKVGRTACFEPRFFINWSNYYFVREDYFRKSRAGASFEFSRKSTLSSKGRGKAFYNIAFFLNNYKIFSFNMDPMWSETGDRYSEINSYYGIPLNFNVFEISSQVVSRLRLSSSYRKWEGVGGLLTRNIFVEQGALIFLYFYLRALCPF